MPDPIPRGETSLRAIVLAISAAEPVNVPRAGCVESVVTVRTHFRFDPRRVAGAVVLREVIMRARNQEVARRPPPSAVTGCRRLRSGLRTLIPQLTFGCLFL